MRWLVLAGMAVTAGCRCGPVANCEMDAVDRFNATHGLALDHLYNPVTDPTRVGRPDWCCRACELGRKLECCRRLGAEDVPDPQFRVYPQPDTKVGTEGPIEELAEEELESVTLPPSPEE